MLFANFFYYIFLTTFRKVKGLKSKKKIKRSCVCVCISTIIHIGIIAFRFGIL